MDNVQKAVSTEDATKILKELDEKGLMSITEELIKDNKICFEINGVQYRSRLLNFREKEELDGLRRKKFGQLLQDKDLMLESRLIEVYKEKGVDIAEIDLKISKLDTLMHEKNLALGEALAKNDTPTIFKAYEEQIVAFATEKNVLNYQRNSLLQYSIESQLLNYVAELITYLATEIADSEGKYKRIWSNYEDFKKCEDLALVEKAGVMSTLLQYSI